MIRVIRVALAAFVITLVAFQVPWRDTLKIGESGPRIEGSVEGPWRGDLVFFSLDEDSKVPVQCDQAWAEELRAGKTVQIQTSQGVSIEPGLPTAFGELEPSAFLWVLAAVFGGFVCGVTRWWGLLRACGAPTPFSTTVRLSLLGMFFNLVVPGLTGGDVVKAGLAAKGHPGNKSAAIMSVGVDRLIGLWTLLWIAAITSWLLRAQLLNLAIPLSVACIASTALVMALASSRIRGAMGASRVLRWLPANLVGLVDSLKAIARSPRRVFIAVLLSAGNHLCIGAAVYAVANGVGDDTGFTGCLAATVVASAVSAIPIAPGGWGVGEYAYGKMFELLGSGRSVGIAVSVTYRLCQTAISLICGVALWRGGGHEWRLKAGSEEG